MSKIQDNIFIHLPLDYFPKFESKIANYQINVEILVTADDLDSQPQKSIEEVGHFLKERQLSCTVHGPFRDLNPGSADSKIRQVSQERFQQLLSLVSPLAPRVVVFHAAFDPLFYEDEVESWLQRSTETWLSVVKTAEKSMTRIAVENILDRTPEIIHKILLKVDSPLFGVCFDVGHFNIFSRVPLSDWIGSLGAKIFELHIHDNHGQRDEHLAVGEGEIDIPGLLSMIREKELSPALTIEAKNEEHAMLSFQRLSSYLSER